jgi:hypothetical protein
VAGAKDGGDLSIELRVARANGRYWLHGWALLGQGNCLPVPRGWLTRG